MEVLNKPSEKTFTSYTSAQATTYASARPTYSSALYDVVLSHHASTGGKFRTLLDVGCGPGNATRDLAAHFEDAVGCDAGEGMIAAAKKLGGRCKGGKEVRFDIAGGENFAELESVGEGVDLLTVAMAAHWFDMNAFWREAAKVVRPGGTVAIWTRVSGFPHPQEAKAAKLKKIMLHFEYEVLRPYELPGNRLSRDLYANLPLPWQVTPSVSSFPESAFVRHEFDKDGILTDGGSFFGGNTTMNLKQAEKGLATASMVTRWREVHPDLAGTEKDCLKMFIEELREALDGQNEFVSGMSTVILLFKRSS